MSLHATQGLLVRQQMQAGLAATVTTVTSQNESCGALHNVADASSRAALAASAAVTEVAITKAAAAQAAMKTGCADTDHTEGSMYR